MPPSDVTVRRARVPDAEALARLARDTFAAAYDDVTEAEAASYSREVLSVERFLEVLKQPDALVLLASTSPDRQIGYAQLRPTDPPGTVAGSRPVELMRLYLRPEVQGWGVGGVLVQEGLGWAVEQDHDVCWLKVWYLNSWAIGFYRKHGFRVVGREAYRAGGMDDVVLIMERRLS